MTIAQIAGLDIGFGFTKVSDGRRLLLFKSVVGAASSASAPPAGALPDAEDAIDIEVDGQRFYIGQLAERYSRERAYTLEQDQLIEGFVRPLGLAALAQILPRGGEVNLVTGLPVEQFAANHKLLAEKLVGPQKLVVRADGQARNCKLHIGRVRVIPQPFGALFGLLLNDIGQLADHQLARRKTAVIDIGFRTADYCIARGTDFQQRGSGSSDDGIATVYRGVAQALREASGVEVELFRLHEAMQVGVVTVDGQAYDLTRIASREYARLATRVAARSKALWARDSDIDTIVLAGGGGAALAPYLRRIVKGRILTSRKSADARFNNVRGYWRYGVSLWQE